MGLGTAWGGRLPCKQDIQMGSIPIRSTIFRRSAKCKQIEYPDFARALPKHTAVTGRK